MFLPSVSFLSLENLIVGSSFESNLPEVGVPMTVKPDSGGSNNWNKLFGPQVSPNSDIYAQILCRFVSFNGAQKNIFSQSESCACGS